MLATKETASANEYMPDHVDVQAIEDAEQYFEANRYNFYANPSESVTRLFDNLSSTYEKRKIYQRTQFGDEQIDMAHVATRTPDRAAIDEIYSEFTVYRYSPNYKKPSTAVHRAVTLFDSNDSWKRIIISDGKMRIVDENDTELQGRRATEVLMDFALRTQQAIGTYNGRSDSEKYEADIDAKEKLKAHSIHESPGVRLERDAKELADQINLDTDQLTVV